MYSRSSNLGIILMNFIKLFFKKPKPIPNENKIKNDPNHDHKNHFLILKNLNISANSYALNYT